MPWDFKSTLDPPDSMLSPAPRVILFRPPLNHVTPLHKTLQAPLLTWNETQNSRNGLQGLACSRQSSAPIPFPSPLLSSPPVRSGSGLRAERWLLAAPHTRPRDPAGSLCARCFPSDLQQLLVHSIAPLGSRLKCHLIGEGSSVHLPKTL